MRAVVVLTTAPNIKTGEKIARFLLEKKLAACVSIKGGFVSRYRWKGKIERVTEALLVIKTAAASFPRVRRAIEKIHPYDVPEILALPVSAGSNKYLKWMAQSLK